MGTLVSKCGVRIWLLQPAPRPLLWLEDPKLLLLGNNDVTMSLDLDFKPKDTGRLVAARLLQPASVQGVIREPL